MLPIACYLQRDLRNKSAHSPENPFHLSPTCLDVPQTYGAGSPARATNAQLKADSQELTALSITSYLLHPRTQRRLRLHLSSDRRHSRPLQLLPSKQPAHLPDLSPARPCTSLRPACAKPLSGS